MTGRSVAICRDGRGNLGEKGGGLATENEDIQLVEISTGEAFRQLDRGEIQDAKTIVGLMWLRFRIGSD